jgi:hypothetical protein
LLDGWDYVASVPAHGDSLYSLVVPTLADSNVSGIHWSAFMVRAATALPLTFFPSPVDSGYSVDNLPPAPPSPFSAAYSDGATHLTWGPNGEADLWYYTLHRGSTSGFVPGPGNLLATVDVTGFDDLGPAGGYYKLAAVDVNGNVSGYALVTPQGTVGVEGEGRLALALGRAGPNPSRDGRVLLSITLPADAPARLELLMRFLAVVLALIATPAAAVTVDGQLDPDYGVALSTQTTQTSLGDMVTGFETYASELDGAFGCVEGGVLHPVPQRAAHLRESAPGLHRRGLRRAESAAQRQSRRRLLY